MKFYSHKRKIIKKETVSGILIKHFYSQVINIFEEVLNQNYGENIFFVIKPKRKPKLSITGATVTLEEIAKLDKIREQFRSKSQFFIKNVPWQYLGLWGLMKQKILLSCEQNHDSNETI